MFLSFKMIICRYVVILLAALSTVAVAAAQDLRELIITKSIESQLVVFAQYPSNAAVMIKSKVPNLWIESNLGIIADLSDRDGGVLRYILSPGRQTLTIKAEGFISVSYQTEVLAARQVLTIDAAPKDIMITDKGGLEITTNPTGARLRIDGIPGSFSTPYVVTDLFAMSYTITAELSGFESQTFRITVNKGVTSVRHIEMTLAEAIIAPITEQRVINRDLIFDLNIKVVPNDADVMINAVLGTQTEKGLINFKLKSGRYLLSVTRDGYSDYEEEFTLNETVPFKLVVLDPIVMVSGSSVNNPQVNDALIPTSSRIEYVSCGGFVRDADGNEYANVTIGIQCWFAENLRTTRYRDGSRISATSDKVTWKKSIIGLWTTYDSDETNDRFFGKLYNWHAVKDSRGLCPAGWKVPAESDWNALAFYLDTSPGGYLKATGSQVWLNPNFGAKDTYGFSGLPGGYYNIYESYMMLGKNATWWSVDQINAYLAWSRGLYYSEDYIVRDPFSKQHGLSVRCLKGI